MEQFRKKVTTRESLLILGVAIILVYGLFFKPSPALRVDWNKVLAGQTMNSALTIQMPAEAPGVGKRFSVQVKVDTKGNYVNAVQSYIEFDPQVLEVVDTNTKDSFCQLYPENNYSNEKGIIRLACGAPYPGFRGEGTIQTIEFLSKAIQMTEIKVAPESMVLANDGKGTNLLTEFDSKELPIKASL